MRVPGPGELVSVSRLRIALFAALAGLVAILVLSGSAPQPVHAQAQLALTDWDDTGLQTLVLMLVEAGADELYRDGLQGTLLTGSDATLEEISADINRIRWINNAIRINKTPSTINFDVYFDNVGQVIGDGHDVSLYIQTDVSTVISTSDQGNIGGGFANFNVSDADERTALNAIADGDRFIFAIARTTANLTPTLPTLTNRTGTQHVAITAFTLPEATGGDTPITYSISGLPTGLSFDAGTREVSGTPTVSGTFTVTYTATDDDGDGIDGTFTFTLDANSLPSLGTPVNRTGQVGTAITSFTLAAATGGDGTVTYAVSNLPPGLSFNTSTRVVSGTPTTAGASTVSYTATDEDSESDSVTFTYTIAADLTPTLGTLTNRSGIVGTTITSFTLPAATGGDTPITYSISGLPAGLTFNTTTRMVSGTPTTPGTPTVTYTATDDDGDAVDGTFTFTVIVAVPTGITATATANTLVVSWTAVSGATGYDVRYRVSGTNNTLGTFASTATTYTITGLTQGVAYEVRVRAKINTETSAWSAWTEFATDSNTAPGHRPACP